MVSQQLAGLSKTTKTIAGIIASMTIILGFMGASYSQVVEKLKDDFTSREEFDNHVDDSSKRFDSMDASIGQTKDAVNSLTEVVLSAQISELRATLAAMEDNRDNWKPYEADIFREKTEMLEDLRKQRDQLRQSN